MTGVPVVGVGASRGGLQALQLLLRGLPAQFGSSIVLAQHRRPDPESHLAELLARHCLLPVIEPEDKTPLEVNHVYLAPGDYHLLVEPGLLVLSVDPPVCYARPSIDVLFESIADAYGPAAVAVVLTSSNEDGAAGARAIKRAGGRVYVQDPETAESPVGPLATLAKTHVDGVLGVEALAGELTRLCKPQRPF